MSYSLTTFQEERLQNAANVGPVMFGILEPAESDSSQRSEELLEELRQMDGLVAQGLLRDLTDKWQDQIALCRSQRGRGFKMYIITDVAFRMFNESDERSVQ